MLLAAPRYAYVSLHLPFIAATYQQFAVAFSLIANRIHIEESVGRRYRCAIRATAARD